MGKRLSLYKKGKFTSAAILSAALVKDGFPPRPAWGYATVWWDKGDGSIPGLKEDFEQS